MRVLSFAALEVNIRVFGTTARDGVSVRVERFLTERFNFIHRDQFLPFCIVDEFDVLDFMAGAEAIKEVNDRGG